MMTLYIPYSQRFNIEQWMHQNYYSVDDYSSVRIADTVAVSFTNTALYTRFYTAWQHIIWADNDS